jgi:opacity protein-like surface antigen
MHDQRPAGLEFFGTARDRLGFTPVEPVLLYVTVGLTYGQVKLSGAITNPACFGFCGTTSTSNYQSGRSAGGGLRLRAELLGGS